MGGYNLLLDSDLTDLIKGGDHAAYTELYNRYFELLYRHARKKVPDHDDARDLVQDTLTSCWQSRDRLDKTKEIGAYLYTILRNKILHWFARQNVNSRYISSFQNYLSTQACTTDHLLRERQLMAVIETEIAALSPRVREVFEMSRKQHLSHREIAEALQISEQTVKTQVKTALKILRSRLGIYLYILMLIKL